MSEKLENLSLKARISIYLAICAVVLISDQLTKSWATETLKGASEWNYLGGMIKLLYAENAGAWGSMGASWPEPLKLIFLIGLPIAALIWVSVRIVRDHNISIYEGTAFALILGGGFGNIIDRIRYEYVVDFLWMGIGPLTTNIFNIADVAIMCAIPLLIVDGFKKRKKTPPLSDSKKGEIPLDSTN